MQAKRNADAHQLATSDRQQRQVRRGRRSFVLLVPSSWHPPKCMWVLNSSPENNAQLFSHGQQVNQGYE